jgi:hypothetical protein
MLGVPAPPTRHSVNRPRTRRALLGVLRCACRDSPRTTCRRRRPSWGRPSWVLRQTWLLLRCWGGWRWGVVVSVRDAAREDGCLVGTGGARRAAVRGALRRGAACRAAAALLLHRPRQHRTAALTQAPCRTTFAPGGASRASNTHCSRARARTLSPAAPARRRCMRRTCRAHRSPPAAAPAPRVQPCAQACVSCVPLLLEGALLLAPAPALLSAASPWTACLL